MRSGMVCLLFAVSVFLGGCAEAEPLQSGHHTPVHLTTWHTYWDMEGGTKDYAALRKKMNAISYFAVSYDENDALYVPEEIRAMAQEYKGKKIETYLSFTNDIVGKRRSEKDRELLRRLLRDDAAIDRTVGEMVALAKEFGVYGVELDYENFAKDQTLLQRYLVLTYRLSTACMQNHLKRRIVLEPSVPFDAGFAKGPEYVVMLYNLYGKHSGPGAKADGAFIEKILTKMEALPENRSVAFATGGCLWRDYGLFGLKSGERRFITEQEAVHLAEMHKVVPERDAESAALHFRFEADGHETEVWYADSETLNAWITLAAHRGISSVSIWRLGGNADLGQIRNQ